MGTWEEESSALLESENEINKDVALDGSYHDGDDVDVKVGVVNVNSDGDGFHDNENNVVTEEGALSEQLERVMLHNNGSDGSNIEEEKREEYGEYDGDDGNNRVYPLRPYAEDCSFYIKTGTCKFEQNCRYNHPSERAFQPVGEKEKGFGENTGLVGDAGKIKCKYFQSPGGCKYGDACRYNHSSPRIESEYPQLNFLGLPIRPSAQECTYYLQNGSCAYGANCRFNHPDPSAMKEFESGDSLANGNSLRGGATLPRNYVGVPLHSFGGVSQAMLGSQHGMNLGNGPRYAPEMSSYYQTMPQTPQWNQNQVVSSFPANKFPPPHQVLNNVPKRVDPLPHYENQMQMQEFPERPGQPDCDYFMKTGNCKYGLACRFNHPTSQVSKLSPPPFSSKGRYPRPETRPPARNSHLHSSNSNNTRNTGMSSTHHQNQQIQDGEFPERAGEPECDYYMKTGQCKFKSACRYNHPRNRVPTSSHCALSEQGLPLRPGAKLCRNYEQQGKCKYGPNCLFNHPDDYSPDVPDAAQFYSSTNIPAATNSDSPAANNPNSTWEDDGWGM